MWMNHSENISYVDHIVLTENCHFTIEIVFWCAIFYHIQIKNELKLRKTIFIYWKCTENYQNQPIYGMWEMDVNDT